MTHDETLSFFLARQQAWQARDADELARTHTADGTVTSPMLGLVQGLEPIVHSYDSVFMVFSDSNYVFDAPIIDGDRIAQPFTFSARHAGDFMGYSGTGRQVQIEGVMFYEMKDGLIAHERRVYDFTGLLIQLGVLRSKPAK